MKLIKYTLIILVFKVLVILSSKLKNITFVKNLQTNKSKKSNNNYKSFNSHISKNNQELFYKYWEMRKNNIHLRINNDELNSFFEGKFYMYGMCMVKYRNYIINLNPFSNSTGNSYFLKYKSEIFDFDICKDVYTYNNRNGMFVDRYKDVIYAGDADEDKYFYIDEKTDEINLELSENKNETILKPIIKDESSQDQSDERIAILSDEQMPKLNDEVKNSSKIKVKKISKIFNLRKFYLFIYILKFHQYTSSFEEISFSL